MRITYPPGLQHKPKQTTCNFPKRMRLLTPCRYYNYSHLIWRTQQCVILSHRWKSLWKGILSLLSITYQNNNLGKFSLSSIYLHSFCSKPKIHQLTYRFHYVSCSHPLALLDLTVKDTKPSASRQSGWGYQGCGVWYSSKGEKLKQALHAWFPHPNPRGRHCCTAPPTAFWKRESKMRFVILTHESFLLHF